MAHIFRLYKGGTTSFTDWYGSPAYPYNSTNRDTIEDPNGASAIHEITSIPSPFARIDLVKNAFSVVTKTKDLDGDTIFHKMVSDAFDVGEIFFNIDKFSDKVEIITWDVATNINKLINSDIDGQRYLGNALDKYLKTGNTYNFANLRNIYLLNFKGGVDALNIIGATSPATLFFSNANDLTYVSNELVFNEDKPFDGDYQPLYKRDFEYVKALFVFRANIPNFATLFPEVNDYLDLTLRRIGHLNKDRNAILTDIINNPPTPDYGTISVRTQNQTNLVEVLGFNIPKKITSIETISSDFEIKSTKVINEKILVLPVESGNRYANLWYITGKWGKENAAPFVDRVPIEQRTLPHDGTKMAYITISDLLEEYIIKVPHTLNTKCFFDGNIKINSGRLSYMLPLKPLFFKFFSAEDLINAKKYFGINLFEMRPLAGDSVAVTLRIPIKGNTGISFVEFNRVYFANNPADVNNNKGAIREIDFAGLMMPFVKFSNIDEAQYKVGCVYNPQVHYDLVFFNNNEKITSISCESRFYNGADEVRKADVYSIDKLNFEFIQVKNSEYHGLLIPIFKPQKKLNGYSFAVDLGTSNTHIEVSKNEESASKALDFGGASPITTKFFVPSRDDSGNIIDLFQEDRLMEIDFVPDNVGGTSDFHFPTRTVLSHAIDSGWSHIEPFVNVNIPLTQDKRVKLSYNESIYNIKWGSGQDQLSLEAYVDSLMLLLRNKVIVEDGDLSRTKITWFYPSSMPNKRLTKLRDAWNNSFQKYFYDGRTRSMTESFAPIQYYFKRYSTTTNLINIDIGGGTSDIAYAIDRKIVFTTSFRFATNVLFENAFSELEEENGIVDAFKGKILNNIHEAGIHELDPIFREYGSKPSNMASFLFSLKDNSILRKLNSNSIDFNNFLSQDDDFRIVFLIYYTAIIYHVAQIVKLKGLSIPRHVSFGGNGSKIIKVITTDPDLLAKFTKLIFEKVFGEKSSVNLEILGIDNKSFPKESTCKGGLQKAEQENESENVVLKADGTDFVKSGDTYSTIDEAYKQRVVDSIDRFFNFFFGLNEDLDFDNNFGVNKAVIAKVKEICCSDAMTFLNKGLTINRTEIDNNDKIEETLFFYPLKGIINSLSQVIYKIKA